MTENFIKKKAIANFKKRSQSVCPHGRCSCGLSNSFGVRVYLDAHPYACCIAVFKIVVEVQDVPFQREIEAFTIGELLSTRERLCKWARKCGVECYGEESESGGVAFLGGLGGDDIESPFRVSIDSVARVVQETREFRAADGIMSARF